MSFTFMAKVKFTSALKPFFPDLSEMEVQADTIHDIIECVNHRVPGISSYLLDENGGLRKHVNVFICEDLIKDRINLSDTVNDHDEVLIYQALSGG